MSEIIIDLKTGILTMGNVRIDINKQQVVIGGDLPVVEVQPVEVVIPEDHQPLSAEQRTTFKDERELQVGNTVLIHGEDWEVERHVKGSHYKVKRHVNRGNSGGLHTTVTERRNASHNKKSGEWSWWEDRKRQRSPSHPISMTCQRCGLRGYNRKTCESIKMPDGEWVQRHRTTETRAYQERYGDEE